MSGAPVFIDLTDDGDPDFSQASLDEWKSSLFESLSSIQRIGGIATFNRYKSIINPGLKIKGNPIIPLPINEQAAQTIKSLCHRDPGDGSSTSNAWVFGPTEFELTNPVWPEFLETMAVDAATTFDIGGVSSVPRHMTLYGPGSIPDQDSTRERTTDAIGTLVIFLPSEHQGADVNLSIETMSLSFSPALSSALDVSAISWLQDVKCEVKDLISGYRLAITYDLWKADPTHPGPHAAQAIQSAMIRIPKLLGTWASNFSGMDKIFLQLVDDNKEGPGSLKETKGHDRTVCQFLNDICPEAGCYFFFAQVTHEVVDDVGDVTVTSTTESVSTSDGLNLPVSYNLDAEKEILGFTEEGLERREADSDDEDDVPPEEVFEERETTRRYHDTAALIVPRQRIMSLMNCKGYASHYGPNSTKFFDDSVENLVEMVATDMERFPDDPKIRQILLDIMTSLSGTDAVLRGSVVERMIGWSLESGDKALFNKTLAVVSCSTIFDAIRVTEPLETYLAKEYLGKEDTVNWEDWLGLLAERSFQVFRESCANIMLSIKNKALSQSFDTWARDVLDAKLETEQKWDHHECSLVLDWIGERSEKPDWVLNSNTPGFLNATDMRRSIIQHGFDKLIVRIGDFGYSRGMTEPVLPLFVQCIEDCHVGGLPEEASRLLAATSAGLIGSRNTWSRNYGRSRAIMAGLVVPLAGLFEKGKAVPVPGVGELLEFLMRDVIRTNIPPFPAQPNGWTYEARGCPCPDCRQLRSFLASPDMQTWEFSAAEQRRKHIQQMLVGDSYSFTFHTTRNRSPFTLVVTKTGGEYRLKVKNWQDGYQQVNKTVSPFRNEVIRECLGDERFRELILLEDYAPHATPPSVAGERRRATWDEPEPQRRRVV
ncbi:hypothetical protein ACHAPT_008613 [Fusarium lateritium]